MEKQLKDFLHLYLGCNMVCITKRNTDLLRNGRIKKLTYLGLNLNSTFTDYKPILRHLDSMTKEEVADLLGIEGFITKGNFCAPFFQVEYKDLNGEENYKHQYYNQLSPDQVVLLLSKHFDLFRLIESGLAISASKLKDEQSTEA